MRALLGDRVTDVEARRETVRVEHFGTPEAFRDYFKARYGPTIAVYRAIAEQPERVAALDRELAELARRFDQGDASTVLEWEYLLLTARVRGSAAVSVGTPEFSDLKESGPTPDGEPGL